MRPQPHRFLRVLAGLIGIVSFTGCAHGRQPGSYLPVGASSWYGDQTADGVTLLLREDAGAARERVGGALRAAGYELKQSADSRRVLRTSPRQLGEDTTLVVEAQIIPVELPEHAASVVLTATYSVPSRKVRNAAVIQRPGEVSPLYARFRPIVDALRGARAPAPSRALHLSKELR